MRSSRSGIRPGKSISLVSYSWMSSTKSIMRWSSRLSSTHFPNRSSTRTGSSSIALATIFTCPTSRSLTRKEKCSTFSKEKEGRNLRWGNSWHLFSIYQSCHGVADADWISWIFGPWLFRLHSCKKSARQRHTQRAFGKRHNGRDRRASLIWDHDNKTEALIYDEIYMSTQ